MGVYGVVGNICHRVSQQNQPLTHNCKIILSCRSGFSGVSWLLKTCSLLHIICINLYVFCLCMGVKIHFISSLLKLCAKTHLNLCSFPFNNYIDSLALFSCNINRFLHWKMISIISLVWQQVQQVDTPIIYALIFLFLCQFFCPKSSP